MRRSWVIILAVAGAAAAAAGGAAVATQLGKNAEVAEFQKLKTLMEARYRSGLCSFDDVLKATMLQNRALYVNGELSKQQWLEKELAANSRLLESQSARLARRDEKIDDLFTFQNWLLTTRELLKRE